MPGITSQSLTSLVKNIKEKKLSSEEVTKAFVDRSEKSKELNSYITEDFSNAIDKSKKFDEKPNLDLKLPGIPIAVKDLFVLKILELQQVVKFLKILFPHMSLQLLKICGIKEQYFLVNLIVMNLLWALQMKLVFLEMFKIR